MKYLILILLIIAYPLKGQIDYSDISIEYGAYNVGFKNIELIDSTRSYNYAQGFSGRSYRPVSISIWEPCKRTSTSRNIQIKDYLEILKNEEEYKSLPFEYFFDWFYIPPTEHNKNQATYNTKAISEYLATQDSFPLVVYSASYQASSTENFMLFEYLASHGIRVVSIPSKGFASRNLEGGNGRDVIAQSRDIDFVISKLRNLGINQSSTITLSGFSFGGLSHIINGENNHNISGIFSLDGTIKYRPELLDEIVEYSIGQFSIPFIHVSQKDIPASILIEQDIDTLINTRFKFYDSIPSLIKYQLKSSVLSHTYFSSYGLLFEERDSIQDKRYHEIKKSYEELLSFTKLSISFLDAIGLNHQSDDEAYLKVINNTHSLELIKRSFRIDKVCDFSDHVRLYDLKRERSFENVYRELKAIDSSYSPAENDLNTLGLERIFSGNRYKEGIEIFKFAIKTYPNSANLHDSLAEGYRYNGHKELAILHFEKSLSLNPLNENAKRRLIELD